MRSEVATIEIIAAIMRMMTMILVIGAMTIMSMTAIVTTTIMMTTLMKVVASPTTMAMTMAVVPMAGAVTQWAVCTTTVMMKMTAIQIVTPSPVAELTPTGLPHHIKLDELRNSNRSPALACLPAMSAVRRQISLPMLPLARPQATNHKPPHPPLFRTPTASDASLPMMTRTARPTLELRLALLIVSSVSSLNPHLLTHVSPDRHESSACQSSA